MFASCAVGKSRQKNTKQKLSQENRLRTVCKGVDDLAGIFTRNIGIATSEQKASSFVPFGLGVLQGSPRVALNYYSCPAKQVGKSGTRHPSPPTGCSVRLLRFHVTATIGYVL